MRIASGRHRGGDLGVVERRPNDRAVQLVGIEHAPGDGLHVVRVDRFDLVDHLIDEELERIAVLDVSEAGLAVARHRLGSRSEQVTWIVGDAAELDEVGRFEIWHDRAAFHFLLEEPARRHYAQLAEQTIPVGGVAIIATFAEDGPERCSGMPVRRYEPGDLERELGTGFRLVGSRRYLHHTPAGVPQMFQYSTFERIEPGAERAREEEIDGDA